MEKDSYILSSNRLGLFWSVSVLLGSLCSWVIIQGASHGKIWHRIFRRLPILLQCHLNLDITLMLPGSSYYGGSRARLRLLVARYWTKLHSFVLILLPLWRLQWWRHILVGLLWVVVCGRRFLRELLIGIRVGFLCCQGRLDVPSHKSRARLVPRLHLVVFHLQLYLKWGQQILAVSLIL